MEFSIAGSIVFKWNFVFSQKLHIFNLWIEQHLISSFECEVCLSMCQWFNMKHSGWIFSKFLPIIEHLRRTILSREKKLGCCITFFQVYIKNIHTIKTIVITIDIILVIWISKDCFGFNRFDFIIKLHKYYVGLLLLNSK